MQNKWSSINPWLKMYTLSQQKPEHDKNIKYSGAINQAATEQQTFFTLSQ